MSSAKIIEDSINTYTGNGDRITTMQIKLRRMVLAELNTHRRLSKNFSSSRAIPTKKLLEQVRTNPVMPLWWGKNQSGMQAKEELDPITKKESQQDWLCAARGAADIAEVMAKKGVHKQIVNRLIEPFMWVEGIVTSTEWENFFSLRCHPDAQPEIQELAYAMRDALNASVPVERDWHLPYITEEERQDVAALQRIDEETLAKISAARCCRVSYLKHDGTAPSVRDDLDLFDKLASGVPIHASPLEHQARVLGNSYASRNFVGWEQFRAIWEDRQSK